MYIMYIYIYLVYLYLYIYIHMSAQCRKQSSLYILWVFNKSNNNWPLHCVSWINSNLQIATIHLIFLKNKNAYTKVRIKLFVKYENIFNLKFKRID